MDEMPFIADFFSGVCMARQDYKFLLTPQIFPSEDQKRSQPTYNYLAYLQLLKPLRAPSPLSLFDKDYRALKQLNCQ